MPSGTYVRKKGIHSGENNPMHGKHRYGKDAPNYGKQHSKETKLKISKAHKGKPSPCGMLGKHHSIESKIKIGIASKKRIQKNGLNSKWCDTKPELIMGEALLKRGFLVTKQYFIQEVGFVDFYLPEINTVIECDGDYWHNLPKQKIEDNRRNNKLKELGYKLLRFWQCDIYKNLDNCLNQI